MRSACRESTPTLYASNSGFWAALSAPAISRLPRFPRLSNRLTPRLPTGAKSSPSTARNFPRRKKCFRASETNFHTAVLGALATRRTSTVRTRRLCRSPSLYGAPNPKRPRRKALPLPRVIFARKNWTVKNHSSYRRAGSCDTINNAAIHCAKGDADYVAPSASQVRSACGAGVAADVAAIRADLAEMRESQENFFENLAALLLRVAEVLNDGGESAPKQPRGSQKCTVEAPPGAAIRTKRGRTSVVVGVRKVAKFQPKTKGKSK